MAEKLKADVSHYEKLKKMNEEDVEAIAQDIREPD